MIKIIHSSKLRLLKLLLLGADLMQNNVSFLGRSETLFTSVQILSLFTMFSTYMDPWQQQIRWGHLCDPPPSRAFCPKTGSWSMLLICSVGSAVLRLSAASI